MTTSARVGSVFLKTTDLTAASEVLRVLFRFAGPAPDARWLEIPGDVPIFVEVVDRAEDLHDAEFGIRVQDAADVREQLAGHDVSELFDVAPGVHGFHVRDGCLQSLFIHE